MLNSNGYINDFMADATAFLKQSRNRGWRPRASHRLPPTKELEKIRLEMFGPPPSLRNSTRNRQAENKAKSGKKPAPPSKPAAEVFGEWTLMPDDLFSFDSDKFGITSLFRSDSTKALDLRPHSAPGASAAPKPTDLKSRCQAIPQTEDFNNRSLSYYLLTDKQNQKLRGLNSMTQVRLNHGNPKHVPATATTSISTTSQTSKRSSMYTSTQSSGYNPQLSAVQQQQAIDPHIPCKNYQRLHKHSTYSDLEICNRNANRTRNYSARAKTAKSSENAVSTTPVPTSNTTARVTDSEPTSNNTSASSKAPRSSSDSETDEAGTTSDDNMNLLSEESQTEEVTHATNETKVLTRESSSKSKRLSAKSGAGDMTESGLTPHQKLLLNKPRTMQEFVETYYMPPTRVSVSNRQLPSITEKNQKLVETILNYRHVLGSREKSEQHKSRYMHLSAPDIRRATVQLLKTSVQKASSQSVNTPNTSTNTMQSTLGQRSNLHSISSLSPILRTESAKQHLLVPAQKQTPVVQETSIPDIGVTWKVSHYES